MQIGFQRPKISIRDKDETIHSSSFVVSCGGCCCGCWVSSSSLELSEFGYGISRAKSHASPRLLSSPMYSSSAVRHLCTHHHPVAPQVNDSVASVPVQSIPGYITDYCPDPPLEDYPTRTRQRTIKLAPRMDYRTREWRMIKSSAKFAVEEINRKYGKQLELVKILDGQRILLAGFLYSLVFEVKDASASDSSLHKFQVGVYDRPWENNKKLVEYTRYW